MEIGQRNECRRREFALVGILGMVEREVATKAKQKRRDLRLMQIEASVSEADIGKIKYDKTTGKIC